MMMIMNNSNTASKKKRRVAPRLTNLLLLLTTGFSEAFVIAPATTLVPRRQLLWGSSDALANNYDAPEQLEKEIHRGLEKAKSLLEKSKAKLQEKNGAPNGETTAAAAATLPFFATASKRLISREGVVKSINETTGQVTADGERMAQISEEEDWEFRTFNEMGSNEKASKQLADRDVAASIYNLRKRLHHEDYRRIFDKRNRFIGEDA